MAACLVVSCGDEAAEGGADPNDPNAETALMVSPSRVDESKVLGGLTPEEQTTLCEDVEAWIQMITTAPAYVQGFCLHSGITSASLAASAQNLSVDQMRQACTERQAQCVVDLMNRTPLPSSNGCDYPTTCTATVGDVKACTVGTYDGFVKVAASLPSCDAMTAETTSMIDNSLLTAAQPVCNRVIACGKPQM